MSPEPFNPQSAQGLDEDFLSPDSGGGDQFNTLDAGSIPVRRKRLSDTTMVLIGSVVLGGAILMGMRWIGTRASMFSVDATVEQTVNEFLTRMTSYRSVTGGSGQDVDPDMVMTTLTVDRTASQVPLRMVKRNPFFRLARYSANDGEAPNDAARQKEETHLAQRRAELERLVDQMRLSSIMGKQGNRVAVLNNLVIQMGDVIDDLFEIVEINSFDIIIRAEGLEFRKSLAE